MLTLALLRHAKSSWDDPDLDDFHRPLGARGLAAAPRIGRWMAGKAVAPDAVLCSTATRTRETLDLVLPELGTASPQIHYLDELYLATPQVLLRRLRSVDPGVRSLLLVGHNPGLQQLAMALVGRGRREEIGALRTKFPTAGLALIDFAADGFADVVPGEGTLKHFVSPRQIA